ncbi:hypothetical protein ACEPAF_5818 [Sanghuangporus sanghuang]
MRSSTLSRTPTPLERDSIMTTPPLTQLPTIRVTTATPSATDTHSSSPSTANILAPKIELAPRKRLVPKKSKLSLLGGTKKEKNKDFSDVARHVGAHSPTLGRSFEIYVDPADDPDIGEIVVLKKKKSRVGLNEVQWGPLGDVTNTEKEQITDSKKGLKKSTPTEASFKDKDDDKDKWWAKRARNDSKGKPKETARMKSKERLTEAAKENRKSSAKDTTKQPVKARKPIPLASSKGSDRRQRSQSLDASALLGPSTGPSKANFISVPMPDDGEKVTTTTTRRGHIRTNTSPSLFGERPSTLQGIAAVTQPSKDEEKPKNGSIALRAIRSVRSLARIGSWAQLKNMPAEGDEQPAKKIKDRKERKKKERTTSMRSSKSGFEALKNTFGSVRKSVDLSGTIRSVSSQATVVSSSSDRTVRHNRTQSGAATVHYDSPRGTDAEPIIGRAPKSSGASTIRWDDQVDTVKERRASGVDPASTAKRAGSKKGSPERRERPGLASLFPDLMQSNSRETENLPGQTAQAGCTEEGSETSTTLLDISSVTSLDSPSRRARPRPLSEQMLGRERPRGVIGDKDTGVIRILDNATSDLACLINRLDLEATPTASPVGESPRSGLLERSRVEDSKPDVVVKKPAKQLSIENLLGSLRAYTHRRKAASISAAETLGRHIVPWPQEDIELKQPERKETRHVLRREERQARSSASPARYEPSPVFHPLPPPSRRVSDASLAMAQNKPRMLEFDPAMPSSFATFGKKRSNGTEGSITPTRTARRARGGRGSSASQSGLVLTSANDIFADAKARPAQEKRNTSGSVGSRSVSFDPEDPDGDIPGELRMLLNKGMQRDASYSTSNYEEVPSKRSSARSSLPSPGTPPREPLPPVRSSVPVFSAPLSDEFSDYNDDAFIASYDDENDTKKSFDFTAELRKLDCDGDGPTDDSSFVMQLEEAFKTPKKYSVRDLGSKLGFGALNAPEVPPVPNMHRSLAQEVVLSESPEVSEMTSDGDYRDSSFSDCLGSDRVDDEDMCVRQPLQEVRPTASSKPSQGRLDLNFKFGGNTSKCSEETNSSENSFIRPECVPRMLTDSCDPTRSSNASTDSADFEQSDSAKVDFLAPFARNQSRCSLDSAHSGKPMTLSDIIPPPDHETRRYSYSSLNEDESAMLRSILAKAANLSDVSLGMNPDRDSTNSNRQRALDRLIAHSRQNSDVSFSGLASYEDIRRGFEFGSSRPVFYPPRPSAASSSLLVPNAAWRSSILSLGSVSSYGRVTRDGAKDPFDYPVPSKRISEDMSCTVEDTFSFLKQDPMRQRVDSGASKYSVDSQYSHIRPDVHQRRNRRQVESIISVTSGPPVSLYNRGFNPGRTTVTWRQRTSSFESVASGFSAHRLERPGVGDKMFESARDLGVPLASISASPSQADSSMNWHSSYDSLVDGERDRYQDSLIDDTGRRSMMGSQESLFGQSSYRPGLMAPAQFRPVSVYSFETRGSPRKDDDTVISMLGGGFVRRRSIRSMLERSPCARMEKRHHRDYVGKVLTRIPSKDDYDYNVDGSPDKARLISRPSFTSAYGSYLQPDVDAKDSSSIDRQSFVSTVSSEAAGCQIDQPTDQNPELSRLSAYDPHFGDDRMSLAQHGLLQRKSLEDCCLSGEGEDNTNTRQSLVVFRRPEAAARKRSASTGQATATSMTDTPPLTRSRTSRSSSQFTGSQGSIDIDRLNVLLASSANVSGSGRSRLHRRGSGHRRKISEARASRTSSVYETIEEAPELHDALSYSCSSSKLSLESTFTQNLPVSDINVVQWESEDVGPALRMMHALQLEARMTVDASRRQWADTPYSIDALQTFQPPPDPAAWKALLEQSKKTFVPLPPEFHGCARRPRTISRPSPYPRVRVFARPPNAPKPAPAPNVAVPAIKITRQIPNPLQEAFARPNAQRRKPVFTALKPKAKVDRVSKDTLDQPGPGSRSSMLLGARKLISGSAKTNTRKSPQKGKENTGQGSSLRIETLRISRPRPLNRQPSAIPRTIRV